MMLAEKYAFEAKCLVPDPQIEVTGEECRHIARVRFHAWAAQLGQELKYPGFDHSELLARFVAAVCAPLFRHRYVDRVCQSMRKSNPLGPPAARQDTARSCWRPTSSLDVAIARSPCDIEHHRGRQSTVHRRTACSPKAKVCKNLLTPSPRRKGTSTTLASRPFIQIYSSEVSPQCPPRFSPLDQPLLDAIFSILLARQSNENKLHHCAARVR